MATWLFKEEPTHYNYAQLEKDGQTTWSGVKNALAQKHLRSVRKGDRVLYYHTGDEKAIVASAAAAADAHPDPDDRTGKSYVVEIVPGASFARPVTLAEIKAAAIFADFDLVRLSRLSVMPVSDAHLREIEKRGRTRLTAAERTAR
jgi:predicted RNA-binding protein with PUA-like domain